MNIQPLVASTNITVIIPRYKSPEWEILGDSRVAQSASMSQRYNREGLNGILKDVFALAECDFVVCTFSSQVSLYQHLNFFVYISTCSINFGIVCTTLLCLQVCRLAYELIQAKHADASERFVSLDDIYYYGGGNGLTQVAVAPHKPRHDDEIELRVGDRIGVAGNHWNGMSKGTNMRTHRVSIEFSYAFIFLRAFQQPNYHHYMISSIRWRIMYDLLFGFTERALSFVQSTQCHKSCGFPVS